MAAAFSALSFIGAGADGYTVWFTKNHGVNWSPAASFSCAPKQASNGAGLTVAVIGYARFSQVSTSGLGWTLYEEAIPATVQWDQQHTIAYGASKFLLLTGLGDVCSSTDGIAWTDHGRILPATPGSFWKSLEWSPNDGRFVALSDSGTTGASASSTTGTSSWTAGNLPSDDSQDRMCVFTGGSGGVFALPINNARTYGTLWNYNTWTQKTIGPSTQWFGIASDGVSTAVITKDVSHVTAQTTYYTTNSGLTWAAGATAPSIPNASSRWQPMWDGTQFVLVACNLDGTNYGYSATTTNITTGTYTKTTTGGFGLDTSYPIFGALINVTTDAWQTKFQSAGSAAHTVYNPIPTNYPTKTIHIPGWGSGIGGASISTKNRAATWQVDTSFGNEGQFSLATDPANQTVLVAAQKNSRNVWTKTGSAATWTKNTNALPSTHTNGPNGVVYGAGKFIYTSNQRVFTSTDGITWADQGVVLSNVPSDRAWLPRDGIFVVSGLSNGSFSSQSADGITWSATTAPNKSIEGSNWLTRMVVFTGGAADTVAVGTRGGSRVRTYTQAGGWVDRYPFSEIYGIASDGVSTGIVTFDLTSTSVKWPIYYTTDSGVTWLEGALCPLLTDSTERWMPYWDGYQFVLVAITISGYPGTNYSATTLDITGTWFREFTLNSATGWGGWAKKDEIGSGMLYDPPPPWISKFQASGTSTAVAIPLGIKFLSSGSSTATAEWVITLEGAGVSTGTSLATGFYPRIHATAYAAGSSTGNMVGSVYLNTNALDVALRRFTFAGTGAVVPVGAFIATLPRFTVAMIGGLYGLSMKFSTPFTVEMTGIYNPPADISIRLPALSASITGIITIPGAIESTLPVMTASFTAINGGVGSFIIALPPLAMTAAGLAGRSAAVDIILPALASGFIGVHQISGALAMSLPRLTGRFKTSYTTAQVLTLVTNTITSAVVMYKNYPYNSMAKIGNSYYAAGPGGFYRIEVGTADDAVPITTRLSTGQLMFGSEYIKRISDFYVGMRSKGDIKLTITVDEGASYEYILSPYDIAQLKQRRTKIGKGLRGKYFKFDIENIAGEDFDFDTMNVMAVATSRRI